ncbi:reverse transcriptase domain-containing protein [Tanacetum coccineum]
MTPSPSSAFFIENVDVLRTMIKEHDQQAKIKATPRRLAYADSDKEAPARKSQRTPSKNKEPAHLRRSRRLEGRSITREKTRRKRSKSRGKKSGYQETSSHSEYEEGSEDTDRGHNTNECYQLKKQIKETVASGKLAHLVKDIRRNNQRNGSQERNNVKVINMIRGEGSLKRPFEGERSDLTDELTFPAIPWNQLTDEPIILEGMIEGHQVRRILVDGRSSSGIMYEHCFRSLNFNIRSRLRRCRTLLVGFLRETYHPLGIIDLRVTMGKAGRNKTVLMKFAIIKYRSPYNIIIGWTRMRSLRAIGSTIHSMIKFPTNQGIIMMETSREALWECR